LKNRGGDLADNGSDNRHTPAFHAMLISREQREFQWQLIAAVVFLGCLILSGIFWVGEMRYALWGATAQAVVVGYDDVYNSNGVRASVVDIDYQYFDEAAKSVCRGSYRLYPPAIMPAPGETFAVRYMPNDAKSSVRADDDFLGPVWATIQFFALLGVGILWVRLSGWLTP
jgi:hypothetical protein